MRNVTSMKENGPQDTIIFVTYYDHSKLWNTLSEELITELSILLTNTASDKQSPKLSGRNNESAILPTFQIRYIPWENDNIPADDAPNYHLQPLLHVFLFRCDDITQYNNSTLRQDVKTWARNVQCQKFRMNLY